MSCGNFLMIAAMINIFNLALFLYLYLYVPDTFSCISNGVVVEFGNKCGEACRSAVEGALANINLMWID